MKYFYLWQNHLGKTCFGITSNLENRKRGYEGHCGFELTFTHTFCGPVNHIEDLEDRVKDDFADFIFKNYEWISEEVDHNEIAEWVKWEAENTYNGLIEECK